jgi:hypothetical protein
MEKVWRKSINIDVKTEKIGGYNVPNIAKFFQHEIYQI